MKTSVQLIKAVAVLIILSSTTVFANLAGKWGSSTATSSGCGSDGCHPGNANPATSITASSASGSFTVAVGSTTKFTIIVAHATMITAGVDIAVKATQTGTANSGTLNAVGTDLHKGPVAYMAGELSHVLPKAMTNHAAQFEVNWTAPAAPGTVYLLVAANATNDDALPDGDVWNFMTPVAITVTPNTGVNEPMLSIAGLNSFPNPVAEYSNISFNLATGGSYQLSIVDAIGNIVNTFADEAAPAGMVNIAWLGDDKNGRSVASGAYRAILRYEGTFQTLPILVAR